MPALGLWPLAIAHRIFGIHAWSMRPVIALAGALTVLPSYGFARRLTGAATSPPSRPPCWRLELARHDQPLLVPGRLRPAAGAGRALAGDSRTRSGAVPPLTDAAGVAGILVGLGVQTYHSARVVPLVAALPAALLLHQGARPAAARLQALVPLVFEYLAHGLPVQLFDEERLSRPAEPGALFVLSAYTYKEEAARLELYLGSEPTPAFVGPPFPGLAEPSFVAYRAR